MKFRTTLIFAALLALGIVGVVYMNKQDARNEEAKKSSEKILDYSGETINEISIWPAGLIARRDSSKWRILEPVQADADDAVINTIADMFEWAKTERIVSSDPNAYHSFGLLPPRGVLVVKSNTNQDTLYVGDDSQIGSFVYARKAGHPDVFLTSSSLWTNINKTAFDFRDKNILSFQQSQAHSVEIKNTHGLFKLVKAGSDWEMQYPKAYRGDSKKIDEIMNRVAYQRAAEFIDEQPVQLAAYGLDAPAYKFSVTLGDNRAQKTLIIGKMKDGKYYAQDIAKPPVFTVDSSFVHVLRVSAADLRNKKLVDSFIAQADEVELSVDDSTFVCSKDTANHWSLLQPVHRKAKDWKLSSILTELQTLTATGFASDDPPSLQPYGLNKPRIRCRASLNGEQILDLALGSDKDAETLYAQKGDDKTVYIVKKDIFHKLQLRLTDLADPDQAVQAITQDN